MSEILVVDDDNSFLNLISQWMEIEGHQVSKAFDGRKASEILANKKFDLVMPGKEGIKLIIDIRKEDQETQIIAVSGAGPNRDAYLANAKKLGANRLLSKPVERDYLIGTVNQLLK